MNHEFKDRVWKAGFSPTIDAESFEDRLRSKYGLTAKYESARLSIGRSLAEASRPEAVRLSAETKGKSIPNTYLATTSTFGCRSSLWMVSLGRQPIQTTSADS